MKQWKNAFEVWKNHCPYIKRGLLTKKEFVRWAIDLRIINQSNKDEFYTFLGFLEESELIYPLIFSKDHMYFPYIFNNFRDYNPSESLIAYYHPFQFFEVLNWFKFMPLKRAPYHFSENFRKYFRIRKLRYKIYEQESTIEFFKKNNWDIDYLQDSLKNWKKELKKIEYVKDYEKSGNELLHQLYIGRTHFLSDESFLIIWVKLESLLVYENAHIYAKTPPEMRLIVKNQFKKNPVDIQQCIENYKIWRENIIKDKESYLTEQEKETLKKFHIIFGHKIGEGDFGHFGTKGNWNDLFDIIPFRKKNILEGFTSYYVNLLSIQRYIERAYWELFGKNIQYRKETTERPYFCFDGDEEVGREYRKSVLLQFELFTSNPFFLYVEGETERTILIEYLKKKKFGFFYNIINIRGHPNILHFYRLCKDSENHEYYFFLDFHNLEQYNSNKEKYSDNCAFFFPDFVTENFTIDEFYTVFLSWVDEIDLQLEESDKKKILGKLEKEKQFSDEIIQEVESEADNNERPTNGFEKVIINYLRQHFSQEIHQIFSEIIELDHNSYISNEKDFKDLVKTNIAERLKLYISTSMDSDPERKNKFRFETKLKPFEDRLNEISSKTPHWV